MNKNIHLIFVLTVFFGLFIPYGTVRADVSLSTAKFFTASLELPTRPTPPTPPSVSGLKKETPKNMEKEPPKKPTNLPITPEKTPSITEPQEKKAPPAKPKDRQTPPALQPTDKETQSSLTVEQINDIREANDEKPVQDKNKENLSQNKFSSLTNKISYGIAIACLLAATAYFYFTTPKETKEPKEPKEPKRATRQAWTSVRNPPPPKRSTVPAKKEIPPLLMEPVKIKNPSLLEQLIKYDMETYGELRSHLDYEQPAYVEKLIKKHGGGDQEKINRAIHLFYVRRNNK